MKATLTLILILAMLKALLIVCRLILRANDCSRNLPMFASPTLCCIYRQTSYIFEKCLAAYMSKLDILIYIYIYFDICVYNFDKYLLTMFASPDLLYIYIDSKSKHDIYICKSIYEKYNSNIFISAKKNMIVLYLPLHGIHMA